MKNNIDGIKVIERTSFSLGKISKGHNSVKNVSRVTVFLCTSPDIGLYLYKVYENILDGIKVIERTLFYRKKLKGA